MTRIGMGRRAQRQRVQCPPAIGQCPGIELLNVPREHGGSLCGQQPYSFLREQTSHGRPASRWWSTVASPPGISDDVVESGAEFLDFVKFGWGTALVTKDLSEKIAVLQNVGVNFYFGGTLFEKFVLQDRLDDFRELCQRFSCQFVEVSNGTIDLTNHEKAGYIRKLSDEFQVISEVGFKDAERSENLPPSRWIECIHEDLDAGARLVTLEARESGRSGICRPNGELRFGLIEELLSSGHRSRDPALRGTVDRSCRTTS